MTRSRKKGPFSEVKVDQKKSLTRSKPFPLYPFKPDQPNPFSPYNPLLEEPQIKNQNPILHQTEERSTLEVSPGPDIYPLDRSLQEKTEGDSQGTPDKEPLNQAQKVWSRRSVVLPQHLGSLFLVHNGKGFTRFKPMEESIGHKFGEFSLTRKMGSHKKKKKQAGRGK